ncbi:MAG: hypothetical protein RI980_1244 [Bacteroidota bacterium]|jgi:hypothetical protein
METNNKKEQEHLTTNLKVEFSICCKKCGQKTSGNYTLIRKIDINEDDSLIPIIDIYKEPK